MPSLKPAERVGLEVRVRMVRAGVKRTELAEVLHLSRTAISRRLNGEIAFDVSELELVAGLLGTTPAALVEEDQSA